MAKKKKSIDSLPVKEMVAAAITSPEGELFDPGNIDELAEAVIAAKRLLEVARQFEYQVRTAIASHAKFEGDCKTVRVRGDKYRLIVTLPDDSWDQAALRDIVEMHPGFAKDVIKPAGLKVAIREYKKIMNESGNEPFLEFKQALLAANKGKIGLPKVAIDDGGKSHGESDNEED